MFAKRRFLLLASVLMILTGSASLHSGVLAEEGPSAGTLIVFESDRGGASGHDIWVMDPARPDEISQLTDTVDNDVDPVLSPDGTKVVFTRHNTAANTMSLWVAYVDGSIPARQITSWWARGAGNLSPGFWYVGDPDGDRIYFVRAQAGGPGDFLWVYAEGNPGQEEHSVIGAEHKNTPDISPDQAHLVFRGYGLYQDLEIGDLSPDGLSVSNIRTLVAADAIPGSRENVSPSWSPDGSRVAFTSDEGHYLANVYTVGVDRSDLKKVTFFSGVYASDPEWSPDSDWIATSILHQFDAPSYSNIFIVPSDGSFSPVFNVSNDEVVHDRLIDWGGHVGPREVPREVAAQFVTDAIMQLPGGIPEDRRQALLDYSSQVLRDIEGGRDTQAVQALVRIDHMVNRLDLADEETARLRALTEALRDSLTWQVWNQNGEMSLTERRIPDIVDDCIAERVDGEDTPDAPTWGIEAATFRGTNVPYIDLAQFRADGRQVYFSAKALDTDPNQQRWGFAKYVQGYVWAGTKCFTEPTWWPPNTQIETEALGIDGKELKIEFKYRIDRSQPLADPDPWSMLAINVWFSSKDPMTTLPPGGDRNERKPLVMDLAAFHEGGDLCAYEDGDAFHYQAGVTNNDRGWRIVEIDLDEHVAEALKKEYAPGSCGRPCSDVPEGCSQIGDGSRATLKIYQFELVLEVHNATIAAYADDIFLMSRPEKVQIPN